MSVSKYLLNKIFGNSSLSKDQYDVADYHLQTLLINLKKCFIVYVIAIVVHSFLLTLYVHAVFVVFRKYAGGWHAETSRNCTVVSALFFILLPNFLYNYVANINIELIIVFQVIVLVIAARYSPADTEKNPLFSKSRRKTMKVRAIIFVLLLTLLCLLFSSLVLRVAILIGELSESVLITPAFYKLLGRSYRNYEKYEVKEPN